MVTTNALSAEVSVARTTWVQPVVANIVGRSPDGATLQSADASVLTTVYPASVAVAPTVGPGNTSASVSGAGSVTWLEMSCLGGAAARGAGSPG